MRNENEVSQIALENSAGKIVGYGRVWQDGASFRWAHPDGSQGSEDTFALAIVAVTECNKDLV